MYMCTFWGLGITPKNASGGHASFAMTQQSQRFTLKYGSIHRVCICVCIHTCAPANASNNVYRGTCPYFKV